MLKIQSIHIEKFKKIPILIFILLLILLCASGGIDYAFHTDNSTRPTKTITKTQTVKESAKPNKATAPHPGLPAPITAAPPVNAKSATTPCSSNTISKLLLVSISSQHMWACETGTLINQSTVTTGMTQAPNNVDDATPTGSWKIYSRQTDQHLRGSDINGSWDDFVQYWIPFDGPIGFHDASWQTFPFGSSQYTTDGSHGCIHLPLDTIAWMYVWAPIGTTVTIIE